MSAHAASPSLPADLRLQLAASPEAQAQCISRWRAAADDIGASDHRWVLHDALVWSAKGLPTACDAALGDCVADAWIGPLPELAARTGAGFLTERLVARVVRESAVTHTPPSPVLFHQALYDLEPHHPLREAAAQWCATEVAQGGSLTLYQDRFWQRRADGAVERQRLRSTPPADAWHVWMST
jgi:hypothetical protein